MYVVVCSWKHNWCFVMRCWPFQFVQSSSTKLLFFVLVRLTGSLWANLFGVRVCAALELALLQELLWYLYVEMPIQVV